MSSVGSSSILFLVFFFFNDTATTEIYTLSLHDALPIWPCAPGTASCQPSGTPSVTWPDRKSTRLNSSHGYISYAVFCLKKKKEHLPNSSLIIYSNNKSDRIKYRRIN